VLVQTADDRVDVRAQPERLGHRPHRIGDGVGRRCAGHHHHDGEAAAEPHHRGLAETHRAIEQGAGDGRDDPRAVLADEREHVPVGHVAFLRVHCTPYPSLDTRFALLGANGKVLLPFV